MCLLLEKRRTHAVHADSVVVAGNRRQQRDNLVQTTEAGLIKGAGAILAAAPAQNCFLSHYFSGFSQHEPE
jgi:hypothetical protein